ncbi:MAG: 1-phosphofructokinase family hexose kinase [Clostridia bacterium]|nr:1-phosphofructokinase family hexose kinase [Clostridia bacterium]
MKIITLTLNPAFDVHCHTAQFLPFHENLVTVTQREAGGKGVNISRALTRNGVENVAVVVLGEENAEGFRKALAADAMCWREIVLPGRIRENITIHADCSNETRISFAGFDCDAALLKQVESTVSDLIDKNTVLTFTGRIPAGLSMPEVKAFLSRMQAKGVKVVIDSKSFSTEDLLTQRPWLIKPNQEEIGEYLGRTVETFDDVLAAATDLHRTGIENVMISLGAQGALLVCRDGCFVATPPRIQAVSTIGAGDSSIAGFLAAMAEGKTLVECLRTAVAYGTAACLTPGTQPPKTEDVQAISAQIQMH